MYLHGCLHVMLHSLQVLLWSALVDCNVGLMYFHPMLLCSMPTKYRPLGMNDCDYGFMSIQYARMQSAIIR